MSGFHYYSWDQFRVITWPVHSVQEMRFQPNAVLWAFPTIHPSSWEYYWPELSVETKTGV